MLKRSNPSRLMRAFFIVAIITTTLITLNAIIKIQLLTKRYGERKIYYELRHNVAKGSSLNSSDFKEHKMFTSDAPEKSIMEQSKLTGFARINLIKGSIAQHSMITAKVSNTIEPNSRIIFVPSQDTITSSMSKNVDLIAVDPQSMIPEVIANNSHILFDLSDKPTSEDHPKGYFIEVTQDEALNVALALSQGDIHLALRN